MKLIACLRQKEFQRKLEESSWSPGGNPRKTSIFSDYGRPELALAAL